MKRFSVLAAAFVSLVVLANYLASRYTVPVGFGYRAPGGVFCIGAVLVLRDWMQQLRGLRWTMPLVYAAGLLSWAMVAIGTLLTFARRQVLPVPALEPAT